MTTAASQLSVITYPHPTLGYRSKPIQRVDAALKSIVDQMFRLMYEHKGVGLAANQVGLPIRLFVMNPTGNPDEGNPVALINPVISRAKGNAESEEGCLSLPGINIPVHRSKSIHVSAYDIQGNEIERDLEGFEARIIQHETDHLDGVLIIDRISELARKSLDAQLEVFRLDFASRQRLGSVPSEQEISDQRRIWELRYC